MVLCQVGFFSINLKLEFDWMSLDATFVRDIPHSGGDRHINYNSRLASNRVSYTSPWR